MKRAKRFIPFLVLTLALAACQMTPQKQAVTTLASLGIGVNQSYEAYLEQVVQGNLPTNDVPYITRDFRAFQASLSAAATAVHFATNATPANPELLSMGDKLLTAITIATRDTRTH